MSDGAANSAMYFVRWAGAPSDMYKTYISEGATNPADKIT
jgi:hypothetical protein